jgi:hypothetical protein
VRLIDWEIAALGDGLWDIAGIVHSLLIPNVLGAPEPLAAAQGARRLADRCALAGYGETNPAPAHLADPRLALLRLTGARIVQTCLESTQMVNQIYPHTPALLQMGLELLTLRRRRANDGVRRHDSVRAAACRDGGRGYVRVRPSARTSPACVERSARWRSQMSATRSAALRRRSTWTATVCCRPMRRRRIRTP